MIEFLHISEMSLKVYMVNINMSQNYEKYDIYKAMKISLKKSMSAGFYYEAIFIEYAIIV